MRDSVVFVTPWNHRKHQVVVLLCGNVYQSRVEFHAWFVLHRVNNAFYACFTNRWLLSSNVEK